jgi:hypothetical protein
LSFRHLCYILLLPRSNKVLARRVNPLSLFSSNQKIVDDQN